MAFDGITIACLRKELSDRLVGGRITKIVQPEADELLLTIKNNAAQYRLLLSASASLPLVYLTEKNKNAPMTAPGFCMLLRKHLGGGRITAVTQPSLERILRFEIEHLDEMGDLCRKYLIAELMGKHSNLIFCREDGTILDSIKHVSLAVSSVREVLPGRTYFIPHTQDKLDPLTASPAEMIEAVCAKPAPLGKAIYTSLTGFSPAMAEELCHRSFLESARPAAALDDRERDMLQHQLLRLMENIKEEDFTPRIYYNGKEPAEFSAVPLTMYEDLDAQSFEDMSGLLESYYAVKNTLTRIHQKSADLRRVVQTALERTRKKYDLQLKQLQDTEKREKYKVWGELIHTYGYGVPEGARSMQALNYYTNEEITIPLDSTLTAQENAKRYFDKYGKLKRTFEAVTKLLEETRNEIEHLELNGQKLALCGLELPVHTYKKFHRSSIDKRDVADLLSHFHTSNHITAEFPDKAPDQYSILLAHNPAYMDAYLEWGANLVLSGHLHGGLVRIPGLGGIVTPQGFFFPKYSGEMTRAGEQTVIVSRGLGSHTLNIRLFNTPELISISLISAEENSCNDL